MTRPPADPKHRHQWILVRTRISRGHVFRFYECVAPGCPNPDFANVDGYPDPPDRG